MSIANIAASLAGGAVAGMAMDGALKGDKNKLPLAAKLAGGTVVGKIAGAMGESGGEDTGTSNADAQRAKAQADADEFKSAWNEETPATT